MRNGTSCLACVVAGFLASFLAGCGGQPGNMPPVANESLDRQVVADMKDKVEKLRAEGKNKEADSMQQVVDVLASQVGKPAEVTEADPNDVGAAPESPEDRMVRTIVQWANEGQIAKAIKLAEEAGEKDPKDRRLVRLLVELTQLAAREKLQAGEEAETYAKFRESAQHARRMASDFAPLDSDERGLVSMALYNDACAAAKDKQVDQTVASLKEAVELGFDSLEQVDGDKDFEAIRGEKAFQEWREGAEAQLAEVRKKHVREELAAHKSFEFDFTLADPQGKSHKLADLKGKIVLVDIWGTWCPPCRMEIPHLIAVHKKYAEQGVVVVGLNYEGGSAEEDGKKITEFVEENGVPYPCLIGDEPTKDQIPNFEGFPTMLFVDRTGKVRLKHVGYTPQAGLEAVIEALLAEGQK